MAVKRFPVEATHILMFARAIGDTNPIYADAQYAKGTEVGAVIAPPTFVQASAQFEDDYPLRPVPGKPWFGSGKEATGLKKDTNASAGGGGNGGVLHAEQHYEYHRPLQAGEVLKGTNLPTKTWEKQGRRGGKLLFSENTIEFRTLDGELVVTARGVGVRTEKVVESK